MKVLFTSICFLLLSVHPASAELMLSNAQIRLLPAQQSQTAAYMKLTNKGQDDITIVAVVSSIASRSEIHKHTMKDGLAHMQAVPEITIKAGQSLEFKPGGYHFMLFNLQKDWSEQQSAQIYLFDTSRNKYAVEARLNKDISTQQKHHHH